jgi:BASS family bile acid:Na+ symporter
MSWTITLPRPRGPLLLALGVFLGLALPALAEAARPLMPAAIFVIVLGTLLRVDGAALAATLRRPAWTLLLPAIVMLACPLFVALGARFSGLRPELALALVLACAAPPSGGTAAVARMLGLDDAGPLVVTLVSMMLAPLSVPLIAFAIGEVALDPFALAVRLGLLLGAAAVIAVFARRHAAGLLDCASGLLDGGVVLSLLVFALATMAGVSVQIRADPELALLCLGLAFAANLGMQLAGAFLLTGSLRQRLTVGLTLGNRNVGLVWSALGTGATPSISLFFAATQLPIYLLPLLIEWIIRIRSAKAFSSEVDTGSREENALKQSAGAVERSNWIGNRASLAKETQHADRTP